MPDVKSRVPNKLINEKSPYLLQHAHNPVDWYPWGPEAFSRAAGEDKPIFLSIGYSTCHWCHVMERESFEDQEVANILNEHFICIKVDREERPDIDSIYMSVCQSLTGHGGWPLTVFLTPEKHPFYAGTYFPKNDNGGMMGLISLLDAVNNAWKSNRRALLDSARQILAFERKESRSDYESNMTEDVIHDTFSQLKYNFDSKFGGFGNAPKFPSPHNLLFLLRYWYSHQEPYALEIVEKTLESMKNGGIYDHIGYGFSRYSTDKKWLVPHFEKMLYDNSLLSLVYAEAFQATGNGSYSETAHQILEYLLRDMTSPDGGFYSAEDADSEGVEGKFYVWSDHEIIEVLGEKDGPEYCKLFDITPSGNFEGMNIPNLIISGGLSDEQKTFSEACRKKLFAYRENRIHPYKDDKILTSWNGLMIAAMAFCGRTLEEPRYIAAAQKCAGFILEKLVRHDGRLLARYRDGEAALPAYLEDYAFLVWGLLELYEATYNPHYLQKAIEFNTAMLDLFGDESSSGLFLYGHDSEELITRPRECYDGAIPSGNSAAVMNLIRLARITGNHDLENRASGIVDFFSPDIEGVPTGHTYMLSAYLYSFTKLSSEIVFCGSGYNDMIKTFNSIYQPFTVAIANITEELTAFIPFVAEYNKSIDKQAAFICHNFSCRTPVTDDMKLKEILTEGFRDY